MNKNDLKKLYTKKQLKQYYSANRSKVSLGMNTGSVTMRSNKDYNRQKMKNEIRERMKRDI